MEQTVKKEKKLEKKINIQSDVNKKWCRREKKKKNKKNKNENLIQCYREMKWCDQEKIKKKLEK